MRSLVLAFAATLALSVSLPAAGIAQPAGGSAAAPAPAAPATPDTPRRSRRTRSTTSAPKREPTAGQLAARERMRKCAVEWKEAKAAKTTGGLRWPQYWSKCNARLKGNGQA